jgi:excisionase family DNA binding protein
VGDQPGGFFGGADLEGGPMIEKHYSLRELGRVLGISHVTLSHRVEEGDLRAVRIGKRVLIPESAASDWLNRHTVNAAAGVRRGRGSAPLAASFS